MPALTAGIPYSRRGQDGSRKNPTKTRGNAPSYRIVALAGRLHGTQKKVSPYRVITRLKPAGFVSGPSPERWSGWNRLATPTNAQSGHHRISVQHSDTICPRPHEHF